MPRETDKRWAGIDMTRYSDETDVLIVGGGPSGLAAACRLKQMAADEGKDVKVTVVEKAAELGLCGARLWVWGGLVGSMWGFSWFYVGV